MSLPRDFANSETTIDCNGASEDACAIRGGVHFVIAVAITTRCESCISVHAAAAAKAGATESEIAGALATAIALNAGAAYTYALRALEAVDAQR